MALDDLQPTSEKGVFYRTEPGRMNGRVKLDRQFVIVYKLATKKYRGVIGWESEGHSTADALARLREFKRNYKNGSGPVCMADVQAIVEAERAAKAEAERSAAAARLAAEEAERNRPTIVSIWNLYLEAKPDLKGLTTDRNRFENYIRPIVGGKTPQEILPLDVERLKIGASKGKIGPAKMVKGANGKAVEIKTAKKPQTVRNVLELLRRIINFAVKRHIVPPVVLHFEMPSVDNVVTEHLTIEQVKQLLLALDQEKDQAAVAIVRLILFTGIRRGEALKLRWENVDLERGRITLKDPKGGKSQILPISAPAIELLKTIPKTSDLVFPGRKGKQRSDLKKPMDRIRKAAGLPAGFRPLHGLRHHYASTLASSGQVDLYTLQKLMTHKSPQMTQRYAHLTDEAMTKAASVAASALESAKSGESPAATVSNGDDSK